ncbi:MAG TPA: sugar-transfer associated ATP-grasp domain-containing protein [Dongiaceae bacterium]
MIAFWPAYILTAALLDVAILGQRVMRECGKSRWRQFGEILRIGFGHGLLPRHYYMFELYRETARTRFHEVLHRTETKAFLYGLLTEKSKWVKGVPPFASKQHFAELCLKNNLPAVPILAVAHRGKLAPVASASLILPQADLFLKPSALRGGLGAEIWRYEDGRYCRYGRQQGRGAVATWLLILGTRPSIDFAKALLWRCIASCRAGTALQCEVLDAAGLCRRLEQMPPQIKYLVQPRLRPHAALVGLGLGVLTTVRVLTCTGLDGEVHVTHAVFRMPITRHAVVDNFHAGGIAAAIDIETGRLGRATDLGLRRDSAWYRTHPITGAQIEGRILPWWPEVADLACRAQRAISDRPFVGWDIAILDSGPCLIEGNGRPDIELIQRPYREPLGNSRFGQILAEHVLHKLGPIVGLPRWPGSIADRSTAYHPGEGVTR